MKTVNLWCVAALVTIVIAATLEADEIELPNDHAAEVLSKDLMTATARARLQYSDDLRHLSAEQARLRYVTSLSAILHRYLRVSKGFAWNYLDKGCEALETELSRYPAPRNSDSKILSRLLVGDWSSPRHDYRYRKNGTWTMLPEEPGTTGGIWSIKGNRFSNFGSAFTIILLNKDYFIYTDKLGQGVYSHKRISR
jgi:hypothetical protein